MKNFLRITTLSIFLLLIPSIAFSVTMHSILVIDTIDEGIGCKYDMENWQKQFPVIKKYTGMKMKTTILKGKKWHKKDVIKAIKKLKPKKDDVVMFYYSGHGFRFEEGQKDPWPYLALQNSVMALLKIYNTLHKKKPRLLLVISDSCNSYCPGAPYVSSGRSSVPKSRIEENYKNLFLRAKGTIISSGCLPGQCSYGGAPQGGAFTSTLIENMLIAVKTKKATWKQIFQASMDPLVGGKQQPQFKMNVDPGNSVIVDDITDNKDENSGGDVDFKNLKDPEWCKQALDQKDIFNNALVLIDAKSYLPKKSKEYKNLLGYAEMQYGFMKDQYKDEYSAAQWMKTIKLIKSASKKGISIKKIRKIRYYLKDEQKFWIRVISKDACVKK